MYKTEKSFCKNLIIDGWLNIAGVCPTLKAEREHAIMTQNASQAQGWQQTEVKSENCTPTLVIENHPNDSRFKLKKDNVFQTLSSRAGTGEGNTPMVLENLIVRRLTPLECERLQGFPDGWTDIGDWVDSKGKKHKGEADSPRYRALGNSIALPFWQWMAERMIKKLDVDEPTMASLFDGIGGFPLVYSRAGCKPVWASEIEEFPIAVTKIRFKEN